LLQLAATRGRLMELLVDRTPAAKEGGRDLIDQAYMVGIFSLMPALMGGSMAEVLLQLPVAPPVYDALGEHSGTLGDLLSLVEFLENSLDGASGAAPADKAGDIMRRLPGIDASYANACLTKALTWANNLARES